tara:strand:- start:1755 stop:2072 length:318 start_codon:yes stop_codon:yes gene_type:complete
MSAGTVEKQLKMGLGEAVRRLFDLEVRFRQGRRTEELTTERLLILEALNRVEIDLGFDCDDDGVPDTVEIFKKTASTSCCRILPSGGGGKKKSSGRIGPGKKLRK